MQGSLCHEHAGRREPAGLTACRGSFPGWKLSRAARCRRSRAACLLPSAERRETWRAHPPACSLAVQEQQVAALVGTLRMPVAEALRGLRRLKRDGERDPKEVRR